MISDSAVRARGDEQTKSEAAAVLKAMGVRRLPSDDGQDCE
jgi:antitoxin component of RelBE/YafQ-DinJ toxin-antitoxin module